MRGGVRALDRGLALLEAISEAPGAQAEIAHRLGFPVSTTFRLLETLRLRGYVTRSQESGRYQVGIRAFEVGSGFVVENMLRDLADPEMRRLVASFNEAVNLAVLDGREAVYIHQIEGNHVVRFFTRLGARVPLYCTGVGKVLMAWGPQDLVVRLLDQAPLQAFTPNTHTRAPDLLAELARVRELGFALDDEERELGVRCVAVPIRDRNGSVVAAMSLSAPAVRLPAQVLGRAQPELIRAANAVSSRLGWPRTPRTVASAVGSPSGDGLGRSEVDT